MPLRPGAVPVSRTQCLASETQTEPLHPALGNLGATCPREKGEHHGKDGVNLDDVT